MKPDEATFHVEQTNELKWNSREQHEARRRDPLLTRVCLLFQVPLYTFADRSNGNLADEQERIVRLKRDASTLKAGQS